MMLSPVTVIGNSIGSDGGWAFAHALRFNVTLRKLDLQGARELSCGDMMYDPVVAGNSIVADAQVQIDYEISVNNDSIRVQQKLSRIALEQGALCPK